MAESEIDRGARKRRDARPAAPAVCGRSAAPSRALQTVLARRVLPPLVAAHGAGRLSAASAANRRRDDGPSLGPADVDRFCEPLLRDDAQASRALFDEMRASGLSDERLMLELMAPAARRLGRLWELDRADFFTVTTGVGRLQVFLHELGRRPMAAGPSIARPAPGRASRVLLTALVGESHVFGLSMVSEFLDRAGFDVLQAPALTPDAAAAAVREAAPQAVGVTLSDARRLAELRAMIVAMRRAAAPGRLGVVLGGLALAAGDEIARAVGADAVAADAAGAADAFASAAAGAEEAVA